MKALEFRKNNLRYGLSNIASKIIPESTSSISPLNLVEIDSPKLPNEQWHRVKPILSGICGSDTSMIEGKTSPYFEPWVSFPFVPGHEILGEVSGKRVVIEPTLGHQCRTNYTKAESENNFNHMLSGPIEPGIQIGFCSSTSGGWAEELIAHKYQIIEIPNSISNEDAALVEPAATAIHATLKAKISKGETVGIIGAGTLGLATIAAVKKFTQAGKIIISAKYPIQENLADEFGADYIEQPDQMTSAVRRLTSSFMIGPDLTGGCDVVIDAVGSPGSIRQSFSITRPNGRVVLMGMPNISKIDLTPLWHREINLIGSYTYGTEKINKEKKRTFELAIDLSKSFSLGRILTNKYALEDYHNALNTAINAGSKDSIKVCFMPN